MATDPAQADHQSAITPTEIFRERAEARALLWTACIYDLHTAVDVLQADAEQSGLIAALGQDAVQTIMAEAFRGLRNSQPDMDSILYELPAPCHGLPASTLKTVEYLVQRNDPHRLRSWLGTCTSGERLAIRRHFERR